MFGETLSPDPPRAFLAAFDNTRWVLLCLDALTDLE